MNNLPHVIVTKAIIIDNDKVLLLSKDRGEAGSSLNWDFPGGRLESGESLLEGLNRELLEETNLKVHIQCPVCVFDAVKNNSHLIIIKYLCITPIGSLKLSLEHTYHKWIAIGSLEDTDVPQNIKHEIYKADQIYRSIKYLK